MENKGFWPEFLSSNNAVVSSPTVIVAFIAIVLTAPIVGLSGAALIYHIFVLGKGLDSPAVNLLIALLGAATGGLGTSLVSHAISSKLPAGWTPSTAKKGD